MNYASVDFSEIQPVVLCGGSGSRLWPLSRRAMPKQFIRLVSGNTMLQDTALAVAPAHGFPSPTFVSNDDFRFLIEEQLDEVGLSAGTLLLEPEARNTAPAITLAALAAAQTDPEQILLVMPSDHVVGDHDGFIETIEKGAALARMGYLVTFGMKPDRPETGYGYIAQGDGVVGAGGCFLVDRFVEKPDHETAVEMLWTGGHFWNSGMFMFSARRFLEMAAHHQPGILNACAQAMAKARRSGATVVPDADSFSGAESISVDYAIMEKTAHAAMVVADFGWSDVGSWDSVADAHASDDRGNCARGETVLEDCSGAYVHATDRLVAAVGVENMVIVETSDAVLVAPKDRAQDVKRVVSRLGDRRRKEVDEPSLVKRPWGTYEGVHKGQNHQVKHIVVRPGGKLSHQYHHFRSEHWVVVSGTAEVTVGARTTTLSENESTFIPVGVPHRLFNPGPEPLHLIEVQHGSYLGEDDIVRLDDVYGRAPKVEDTETPYLAVAAE